MWTISSKINDQGSTYLFTRAFFLISSSVQKITIVHVTRSLIWFFAVEKQISLLYCRCTHLRDL